MVCIVFHLLTTTLGIFVVISVWTQDSTVFFNLFKIAV